MRAIVEIYRRTRKTPDLWWNLYVCRPLAAVVVWALERTRVTPDQITLLSLVVGLGSSALLVVWPGTLGLVVAILVLEAAYVLDCADGMLARLRGVASPAGHLLDFLMDEVKAFFLLGAVAVRLYRERGEVLFLYAGIAGLVVLSTGIAITTFQRRPELAQPRSDQASPPARPSLLRRLIGLAETGAKFLIHYPSYIWLPAALGRIDYFFWPYVAVNAAYAVRVLGWVFLRFGRPR
jgi:phosphatidylglycerophosphate synthase